MKKENWFYRAIIIVLIIAAFLIGQFTTVNEYQSKALQAYENKAICDTLAVQLQQSDKQYQMMMEALEQNALSGKPITFMAKNKKIYQIRLTEK